MIKKALIDWAKTDEVISPLINSIYPTLNPFTEEQIKSAITSKLYPMMTVSHPTSKGERDRDITGQDKGPRRSNVLVDFTTVINNSNMAHSREEEREKEFEKIYSHDISFEKIAQRFIEFFKEPRALGQVAIHNVTILDERAFDELLTKKVAANSSFYRDVLALSILNTPIIPIIN